MFSTSVVNYNTGADFPIPSEAEQDNHNNHHDIKQQRQHDPHKPF